MRCMRWRRSSKDCDCGMWNAHVACCNMCLPPSDDPEHAARIDWLMTWRIPNVALSCPVDLAEERRVGSAKRRMYITIPPGVTLDGEVYLEGQDGSLWRAEAVSALEAVAHEV